MGEEPVNKDIPHTGMALHNKRLLFARRLLI